jgi:hypothetical protein
MKLERLLWIVLVVLLCTGFMMYENGVDTPGYASEEMAPATPAAPGDTAPPMFEPPSDQRPGTDRITGMVAYGEFIPAAISSVETGGALRLTEIARQEAVPPDAAEIFLDEFEGRAVMVEGYLDSGWIYEAEVIEVASPILSEVVKYLILE